MGKTRGRENPPRASNRRPSASLAFVLMTQLQFLATLSLVDYTVREDSWLADFVTGLRCDGWHVASFSGGRTDGRVWSRCMFRQTLLSARTSGCSEFTTLISRFGVRNSRQRADSRINERWSSPAYPSGQSLYPTRKGAAILYSEPPLTFRRFDQPLSGANSSVHAPGPKTTDGSTSGGQRQRRLQKTLRRKSVPSTPGQARSAPWCSWATSFWSWVPSWGCSCST